MTNIKRTVIVGDVHGCSHELRTLISTVGVEKSDLWVFIGDLTHKGPDSAGVCRTVRLLAENVGLLRLIRGNWEDKALRKFNRHNPDIDISKEDWELLEGSRYFLQLPGLGNGHIVTHGGIPTELNDRPLPTAEQIKEMSRRERKYYERMTVQRYVDRETGKFVPLNDYDPEKHVLWAEMYDGRYGHCIFGHQPFHEAKDVVQFPHATCIDLGCVQGGHLAALVFDNLEDTDPSSVLVPAREQYVEPRDI